MWLDFRLPEPEAFGGRNPMQRMSDFSNDKLDRTLAEYRSDVFVEE
jgi:hypothetical protein